jgi:hypothetical protein
LIRSSEQRLPQSCTSFQQSERRRQNLFLSRLSFSSSAYVLIFKNGDSSLSLELRDSNLADYSLCQTLGVSLDLARSDLGEAPVEVFDGGVIGRLGVD